MRLTRPEKKLQMSTAAPRSQIAEAFSFRRPGRLPGLSDLFMPLDNLLVCGGDPRLVLDPTCGLNEYGCGPFPAPDTLCFASSTASPISERAYERVGLAREKLMRSAIAVGLEDAFDARTEDMREELRSCLRLSAAEADIVFSPSGTDAQLHALLLARGLLGSRLTSVVVGSDQTGSGTAFTARGRHFASITASERTVRRDAPIAGLACDSVALPLIDGVGDMRARANGDLAVLDAVEAAVEGGASVLLQIMDSSKLGWRAPSEACLDEVASRWPDDVQVVVDACQMRLSRRRIRAYLDRGYMVIVTGSKFFGGSAFSGALLVPASLKRSLDRADSTPSGILDYAACTDWPKGWTALRSQFERRPNFGQWLRWEAALEEIRSYYDVPDEFRALALRELRIGIESLTALSPSLRPFGTAQKTGAADDEEFCGATIFPFTLHRGHGALPVTECRMVHRALARDLGDALAGSAADRELAARRCLVGQPVRIERGGEQPTAVLRLCLGAGLVTEAWSPDAGLARRNLQRELDRIASVIAKIELVLARASAPEFSEFCHGI
jgi:hypothetical protein